jgi:hypothetical protein
VLTQFLVPLEPADPLLGAGKENRNKRLAVENEGSRKRREWRGVMKLHFAWKGSGQDPVWWIEVIGMGSCDRAALDRHRIFFAGSGQAEDTRAVNKISGEMPTKLDVVPGREAYVRRGMVKQSAVKRMESLERNIMAQAPWHGDFQARIPQFENTADDFVILLS